MVRPRVLARRRVAAVMIVAMTACGGATRRELLAIATELDAARARGAASCAPADLRTADAHLTQARADLEAGDTCSADDELARAERQLAAVLAATTPRRCKRGTAPDPDRDRDGLTDPRDGCPAAAEDVDGYVDGDGCPDPDNDDDGLRDPADRCPELPEDRDGHLDEDGCPDVDDDGDGIRDGDDHCPREPEDRDGANDGDGCPDCDDDFDGVPECPQALDRCPGQAGFPPDGCGERYHYVKVTEFRIELKQTIYFATGKATIMRVSHPLLAEVARAMADHPTLHVRIDGHTDSQGNADFNLKLSQRRAAAVRRYLITKAVAAERMITQGSGETVPIADNRTRAGRDTNRRVEFVIVRR